MSGITAQVSVYPLGQISLSPAIDETLRILREHGLSVEESLMSSLIIGEEDGVFTALQEAYHQISAQGSVVMVVTFSNACPVPGEREEVAT